MTDLSWPLAVVVTEPSRAERVRGILTPARYRVLPVSDWETAAARIAGGGVDLVVVSPDSRRTPSWADIAALAKRAPGLRLIVLAEGPAVPVEASLPGMPPVVREADLVATARKLIAGNSRKSGAARIVSLQGVKGGTGTSTAALNLAAWLSAHGERKIILAEMRPGLGTLESHFRPRKNRTLADLLALPEDAIGVAELANCLWPCPQIPGLNLLFAPHALDRAGDWAASASRILGLASETADYVVVDLAPSVSSVNRAVMRSTDYLLLVLERDALCLESGKQMVGALDAENLLPHATGVVTVSRVPLSSPVTLPEVERELNLPILGSIPPGPDQCLQAFQSQTAIVTLDPEGLLGESYANLAKAVTAALRGPLRHSGNIPAPTVGTSS